MVNPTAHGLKGNTKRRPGPVSRPWGAAHVAHIDVMSEHSNVVHFVGKVLKDGWVIHGIGVVAVKAELGLAGCC